MAVAWLTPEKVDRLGHIVDAMKAGRNAEACSGTIDGPTPSDTDAADATPSILGR
jgi:hypothetical protein